jgi:FKBP-type peptidyl-prolyl cis-trans isomerase FklB
MKSIFIAGASLILLAGFCLAEETKPLESEDDRTNYSLGYQIGGDFKQQGMDIDPAAFRRGTEDALSGAGPQISREDMRSSLIEVKKKILARQQAEKLEVQELRLEEGKKYLAENAKEEGVITLPDGLQYKVIKEGSGKAPAATDKVTVHYKSALIDGTEFGNSFRKGKPETFSVSGVIPGLTEALQLMKEGATWRLFIPSELAFGRRGALAGRTVIYDIELISVSAAESEISPATTNQ